MNKKYSWLFVTLILHGCIYTAEQATESEEESEESSENSADQTSKGAVVVAGAVSNQVKNFKCTFRDCSAAFPLRRDLGVHERIHTGERPFQCTFCPAAFKQSGQLTTHVRSHTGEKPFKCSECGRAFARGNDLRAHVRIHTGERPFECSQCQRTFTKSGNLRAHERVHERRHERRHERNHETSSFFDQGDGEDSVQETLTIQSQASVAPQQQQQLVILQQIEQQQQAQQQQQPIPVPHVGGFVPQQQLVFIPLQLQIPQLFVRLQLIDLQIAGLNQSILHEQATIALWVNYRSTNQLFVVPVQEVNAIQQIQVLNTQLQSLLVQRNYIATLLGLMNQSQQPPTTSYQ